MGAVIEHSELIDTCWDVNLHDKDVNPTGEAELIDTCWNVNDLKSAVLTVQMQELIDTCWNVNNIARPAGSATSRN